MVIAAASALSKGWNPPSYWPLIARSKSFFSVSSICVWRVALEIVRVGVVDHVLADIDQLPAQVEIMDRAAVIGGVDDGDHRGRQPPEILGAADLGERAVLIEQILERDRIGDLAALDQLGDGGEDAAMNRLGEVLGQQEVGDAVKGGVVDQYRAQERLLRFDVVRRRAQRAAVAQRRNLGRCGIIHGGECYQFASGENTRIPCTGLWNAGTQASGYIAAARRHGSRPRVRSSRARREASLRASAQAARSAAGARWLRSQSVM